MLSEVLTPEEFKQKMTELFMGVGSQVDYDEARRHAHLVIFDLLEDFGYEKGVKIFKEFEGYYE